MQNTIKYPHARLSPAKDEIVIVEFARRHIESDDITEVLAALQPMAASRANAELFEGRVAFFFSGWDDDPRETAEIPEIRAWFGKLTGEFPYWFHFVEKEGSTLSHVLRLLCKGSYQKGLEPGMVGWRFANRAELSITLETLFCYMNWLYERLGLDKEIYRRVSEEVKQFLRVRIN